MRYGWSIFSEHSGVVPTHQLGGLLDVVAATRRNLTAPDVKVVDVGLSDHRVLQWSVSSARPMLVIETVVRCPWTSMASGQLYRHLFFVNLIVGLAWMSASLYDTELTAMLDSAVPARTVTRRPRSSDPWFDASRSDTSRSDTTV